MSDGYIVNSLAKIGDKRAVPVLKKYLMMPLEKSQIPPKNAAWALYKITKKSYKYGSSVANLL